MNQSEKLDELAPAFIDAQKKFKPVAKTKTGTIRENGCERTYKFADFNDVMEMALPILHKHDLAFNQGMTHVDGETRLATRILHRSGQWISSDGIPLHRNIPPQEMGSQITFFRRYDGCAMLGITPDEDEDGTIANQRVKAAQGKAAQASPRPQSTPASVPTQQTQAQRNARKGGNSTQAQGQTPRKRAWSITSELLTCEPLNAQPVDRDGKKFIAVKLNDKIGDGTMAFCFVEKLFGALRNCVDQKSTFRIDLTGEYPYITDVLEIAGRKYEGGVPVSTKPAQPVPEPTTAEKEQFWADGETVHPKPEAEKKQDPLAITDDDLPSEFWGSEGRPDAAV